MDMSQVWARLATSTRTWLIEHNGEPLPDDILDEILIVSAGQRDPRWWAGNSHEGETQLTDEAVDWIDETRFEPLIDEVTPLVEAANRLIELR